MKIEYVNGYKHLEEKDLEPVKDSEIFFDPPDTEVGCWVGHDLLSKTTPSVVLDLGSGSGATIASFVRNGASFAMGIDISSNSIQWARTHYVNGIYHGKTKFELFDFLQSSPEKLQGMYDSCMPTIVTSNPAYVPMKLEDNQMISSLDGGLDGLKFLPSIIKYAQFFKADLGVTLGSYSSIRKAINMLFEEGFTIKSLTLSTLPFSDLSKRYFSQIELLMNNQEALVWNANYDNPFGYLIVGISAQNNRRENISKAQSLDGDAVFKVIESACLSKTKKLENLERLQENTQDFHIRILDLPYPEERFHW